MRLLLDSHVLLWWLDDPSRLSPAVQAAIRNADNAVFFSPASIWELGLKTAKGKLHLPLDFTSHLQSDNIVELAVIAEHAMRTLTLPSIHLDPFDRMLIAQALVEGLVLATRDQAIRRYDVPTIEA